MVSKHDLTFYRRSKALKSSPKRKYVLNDSENWITKNSTKNYMYGMARMKFTDDDHYVCCLYFLCSLRLVFGTYDMDLKYNIMKWNVVFR